MLIKKIITEKSVSHQHSGTHFANHQVESYKKIMYFFPQPTYAKKRVRSAIFMWILINLFSSWRSCTCRSIHKLPS